MPWVETRFERDALYAQVWAEPVTKVAQRYGLSDVGLRKICVKLGVPLPPAGYWARVAAGQTPRVTPLQPSKQTVYVRRHKADEHCSEREERIRKVLADRLPPTEPSKAARQRNTGLVARTAKALAKKPADGVTHTAHGPEVLSVAVSSGQIERAVELLRALVDSLERAGILFEADEEGRRVSIRAGRQLFTLQLSEKFDRIERELTATEKAKRAKGEYVYLTNQYIYRPTGRLTLAMQAPLGSMSVSDGKRQRVEDKLAELPELVWRRASQLQVEQELRDEEHARWRARWEAAERRQAIRQQNLERLKNVEALAERLDRANRLRVYADKLAASHPAHPDTVEAEVAWIRRAANWLDPLVRSRWPEVDSETSSPDE